MLTYRMIPRSAPQRKKSSSWTAAQELTQPAVSAVGTLGCQSRTASVPDAEDDAGHEERSDAVQCLLRR